MKMKSLILTLSCLFLLALPAFAQRGQPSQINSLGISSHPIISVAATNGTLALWGNPAALGINKGFGTFVLYPADSADYLQDYAIGYRIGSFAMSGEYVNDVPAGGIKCRQYYWGLGFDISDGVYLGTRYRFSKGINQQNEWSVGLLARPYSWASVGAVARNSNEARFAGLKTKSAFDFGVSIRPLAFLDWRHSHRLTLGFDATAYEAGTVKYGDKLDPRYLIEIEPYDGIKGTVQYAADSEELRGGLAITSMRSSSGFFSRQAKGENKGGVLILNYESDGLMSWDFDEKDKFIQMRMPSTFVEQREPFSFFSTRSPELEKFLKKIRRLKKDKHVKGIIFEIGDMAIGTAKTQAILRELKQFKAEGKVIYVYTKSLNNRAYMLASIADKVYMYPEGVLMLNGFASGTPYIKGALDKLGIEFQVAASGPHKTAPNMYTQKHMTAEERAQREWLVGDLYRQFVEAIATNRNMTQEQVRKLIDEGPFLPKDAVEAKLIDGTMYPDEVDKKFKEMFGDKKISIEKGSEYFMLPEVDPRWDRPLEPKIGIVYGVGSIVSGKSGSSLLGGRSMGSETMVKAIRAARKDKQVKAIVLRVDSPGGSGFASDEMWRELMLCKLDEDTKKPVIISFSDVAASGGYYIATPGEAIIAEEGSITGSIGVFGLIPNIDSTLKKLDANYEEVKFGKHAGMFNLLRRNTPEEHALIEKMVHDFYKDFVQKVADSRKKTWDGIDSIANGRVWTGAQALKNGLVDSLGGLDLAIEIAIAKANIPDRIKPDVVVYSGGAEYTMALELENIMVRALPAPLREALKASYAVTSNNSNEIQLMAPEWLSETSEEVRNAVQSEE